MPFRSIASHQPRRRAPPETPLQPPYLLLEVVSSLCLLPSSMDRQTKYTQFLLDRTHKPLSFFSFLAAPKITKLRLSSRIMAARQTAAIASGHFRRHCHCLPQAPICSNICTRNKTIEHLELHVICLVGTKQAYGEHYSGPRESITI